MEVMRYRDGRKRNFLWEKAIAKIGRLTSQRRRKRRTEIVHNFFNIESYPTAGYVTAGEKLHTRDPEMSKKIVITNVKRHDYEGVLKKFFFYWVGRYLP